MKSLKLLSIIFAALLLTSCGPEGKASIEKSLVVEQVNKNSKDVNCSDCLRSVYAYKVKLKTNSGSVYYYTDYKHEVGDTLLSIFEFTDSRDGIIKQTEYERDSIIEVNKKIQKKNDELELYNELLMGIIQDNATKDKKYE